MTALGMHVAADRCGQRFGRLIVISRSSRKSLNKAWWNCRCDCGRMTETHTSNLLSGNTKSCGCLKSTHRMSNSRVYRIWKGMRERCLNPNSKNYTMYGARGIVLCTEWLQFPQFADWALRNGYSDTLSIDRINGALGYEPSNCRWADQKTQSENRKSVKINDKLAADIADRLAQGASQRTVAACYSISQQTVSRVARRFRVKISHEADAAALLCCCEQAQVRLLRQ